ncbi:MAG: 3-oxoacyl-ACP synthase [Bacteroidetes bacterium]|jgi:3-oxoacyl-[acyl-carrier-protein] synthase II|nr:3-oxoacyl-ACP synthase [Bacteroidota bacterium]MBT6686354.1 3-oxoacyl-ACP synthase [Bacteroidota bacterium]MBT7142187.1 3-oxoacyl-ACP synthase [Bacteroidota bacterium]MBT7490458.1 3-oxoacyl-ACP synthase [Bacteroidota bacterium]
MNVFINSTEAITAQNTFDSNEFLRNLKKPEKNYFTCLNPNYKNYINPKLLRRMSKIVRMGVACSIQVLQKANIEQPDAIIIGTGLGCIDDTIKFLNQIIENDESLLNPTPFIQSTHNTVSGQIALLLTCKNYNFTFSQQAASFETALIDAFLMLQEKNESNILLGGLDEITETSYSLMEKVGCTKVPVDDIFTTKTKGYIPGEGAGFFTLSNIVSEKNIACLKGVSVFNNDNNGNLLEDLQALFSKNNVSIADIDVLISGMNGDFYEDRNYSSIQKVFQTSIHLAYKHLIGEFDTASCFAMYIGTKIFQSQIIPEALKINGTKRNFIKNILIHNYNNEHKHSFIILSKC